MVWMKEVLSCFGVTICGSLALFADINEPQFYDVKAMIYWCNPFENI